MSYLQFSAGSGRASGPAIFSGWFKYEADHKLNDFPVNINSSSIEVVYFLSKPGIEVDMLVQIRWLHKTTTPLYFTSGRLIYPADNNCGFVCNKSLLQDAPRNGEVFNSRIAENNSGLSFATVSEI
jgi:hypothetical protein